MNLRNKIKWRFKYLGELLKNPFGEFSLYLFAHLLPTGSFVADMIHRKYIKDFTVSTEGNDVVLDLKLFKIVVDKAHCTTNRAITAQFFDLIYPDLVKKPIVLREGPHEKDGVQLKEGDVVIDAGAYIGLFTMLASKKVGPTGKVYAFEPIVENYELLKKTIKLNNVQNVEIIPYALADKKGILSMVMEEGQFNKSSAYFNKGSLKREINQTSIDEFAKEKNIAKIDFIKADIEGFEREMLAGGMETMKKSKPRLAICTYHKPDDREVIKGLIESSGHQYSFTQIDKKLYAW